MCILCSLVPTASLPGVVINRQVQLSQKERKAYVDNCGEEPSITTGGALILFAGMVLGGAAGWAILSGTLAHKIEELRAKNERLEANGTAQYVSQLEAELASVNARYSKLVHHNLYGGR